MGVNIQGMQADLRAARLDGWLFYDFRGRDPIAQRILQVPEGMRTRRWFYCVPAKGTPKKLVHKIESQSLAGLPGETFYYAGLEFSIACGLGQFFQLEGLFERKFAYRGARDFSQVRAAA